VGLVPKFNTAWDGSLGMEYATCGASTLAQNVGMNPWMSILVKTTRKVLPEGYSLYLFGSRAGDTASSASDYDLGVLGSQPLPPGILTQLEDLGDEIPTLDKLDWVDLGRATAQFRKVAMANAVRLA